MRNNPYPLSDDNKRYQTYNYYLKHRFGRKVYRIALDIGAGCPNRDGTKGMGGCIFCSAANSRCGEFRGCGEAEITRQLDEGRRLIGGKCADGPYIAYFQAGTNTYGDSELFSRAFSAALAYDNTVGLTVATRADCIDEEKADMLARFAERTYLTVELGLQTVHDSTAALCNRCHTFNEFLAAYKLLRARNINVGVHIINGLPHETHEMMNETARQLSALELHCIKIHLLYIERGTPILQMYNRGEFSALSREEYVSIVCDQLELLSPQLIIARLTGDGEREKLVAPEWSKKKLCVMNEIDKEMCRRNSWQGKFYKK